MKFLESLRRPIDQFYHEATPITCILTALPGLCTAMRTVESVSRYYARQGYLGLLFTKVTNQLVNICSEYLFEMTESFENEEYFWPKIFKELETANLDEQDDQGKCESVQRMTNKRDISTGLHIQKKSTEQELASNSDKFYQRLKTCLMVQAKYKEAFRNLRDALGGTQALQSFPSISSIQNSVDQQTISASKLGKSRRSTVFSSMTNEQVNHGILMSEEEVT